MIFLLLLLLFRKKKKIKSKGVGGVGYPLKSHRGGERTSLGGYLHPLHLFHFIIHRLHPLYALSGMTNALSLLSYHPPQPTKHTNTHTHTHTHTHTNTNTHTYTQTHTHYISSGVFVCFMYIIVASVVFNIITLCRSASLYSCARFLVPLFFVYLSPQRQLVLVCHHHMCHSNFVLVCPY